MNNMEIESPKERPPYEWLRYIARVDLSKVTDVQSLRFAIEELPECIAYHKNWLADMGQLFDSYDADSDDTDVVEVKAELETLKRALTCAKVSLDAVTDLGPAEPDVETFTCDTCGKYLLAKVTG